MHVQTAHVALGRLGSGEESSRGGMTLALWGVGVNLLVGAMVIAGVTLTSLSLQMMRHR